jgi:hypothetical protein
MLKHWWWVTNLKSIYSLLLPTCATDTFSVSSVQLVQCTWFSGYQNYISTYTKIYVFFETGTCYAASLKLMILLPWPPECWDYKQVPPHPASKLYFNTCCEEQRLHWVLLVFWDHIDSRWLESAVWILGDECGEGMYFERHEVFDDWMNKCTSWERRNVRAMK